MLVPGFWRGAAGSILNDHADRVINGGERFLPDELGEIEGAVVRYEEIPGDFLGDPTRLRIVGLPQEHGFEEGANERRSAALGRTGRPPVGVSTHSQGLQPCSKRCLLMAP